MVIPEPFDKYEMIGDGETKPLLKLWAKVGGQWLKDRQVPFIYNDYPIAPNATIKNRDTSILGFVPLRSLYISTYTEPYRLLSETEKSSGTTNFTGGKSYMYYQLSPVTYSDYQDIGTALALSSVSSPRRTQILSELYPSIMVNTDYPVYVKYQIIDKDGSMNTIKLNYTIDWTD
jgi:hypothetical protein